MSDRASKYPISMEELRRTCPLVKVDVISDGKGGDILVGIYEGVTHVRVPCKKVTKASVDTFREAYFKAIKIGVIKPTAATPKPARAATIVAGDAAGSPAESGEASSDEVIEDEPIV